MSAAPGETAVQPALPRAALARLLRDAQADLADYALLAELLEEQFACALRHEAAPLQDLVPRILALVDQLDERRAMRVALVQRLLGEDAAGGMAALTARLVPPQRAAVQALWDRLEEAVRDCKARNARNARLMTEQQALLTRVLHGAQEPLYADA